MTTAHVTYLSDLRTRAIHSLSGDSILTDAPPDNQGKGEAFSPTDLLSTALASCMLTIIGIAAREHGFSIDGTRTEVTKTMTAAPRKVGKVDIQVFFPPLPYTPKEKRIIEAAARTCPVSLSLHPDLIQAIQFHYHD